MEDMEKQCQYNTIFEIVKCHGMYICTYRPLCGTECVMQFKCFNSLIDFINSNLR